MLGGAEGLSGRPWSPSRSNFEGAQSRIMFVIIEWAIVRTCDEAIEGWLSVGSEHRDRLTCPILSAEFDTNGNST